MKMNGIQWLRPVNVLVMLGFCLLGVSRAEAATRSETGSIAIVQTNPKLGDSVTFQASFSPTNLDSKTKGGVRVQVLCYQDGQLTFATAGHYDEPVLLGGGWSKWLEVGGPAHCQADLYYWSYTKSTQKFNPIASTSFEAAGK